MVSVEVEALDRSRLLRDVAEVLSENHVNILVVHVARRRPTASRDIRFEFELADPGHLDALMAALKRVDAVYDVTRCHARAPRRAVC